MVKMKAVVTGVGVAMFGEPDVIEKRRRGSRRMLADSVLSDLSSGEFSVSIASIMNSDVYDSSSSSEEEDSRNISDQESTQIQKPSGPPAPAHQLLDHGVKGSENAHCNTMNGLAGSTSSKVAQLEDYDSMKAKIAARFSKGSNSASNLCSHKLCDKPSGGTSERSCEKLSSKPSSKHGRERRRSSRRSFKSLPKFDLETLLVDNTIDVPQADDFDDTTSISSKLSGVSLGDYEQSLARMAARFDGSNSTLGSSWVSGGVRRRKSSTLVDFSMYDLGGEDFWDSDEEDDETEKKLRK